MSDLEDALRLALRSRDSWGTLQGTLVTWTHNARSTEAHRRASERNGGSQVMYATGEPEAEPPAEHESRTRLWIALPDRGRSETRSPGGPAGEWEMTMVVHGDTFWMHHPQTGAITNNGDGSHQGGLGIDPVVLDPTALILSSVVRIAGEATVAERRGVLLRMEPRRGSVLTGRDFDHPNWTGSPVELVLDAEHGVGLSLTLFIDGEPFQRTAFTEIAFDAPIPEERLTFTAPPGAEIRDAAEAFAGHRARPLHEIAARAGFVVLAARSLRPGWSVVAHHTEGIGSSADEGVHLFYCSDDGGAQVNVNQTGAGAGEGVRKAPDGPAWRTERHEGTDYLLWEPADGDWPMDRQVVFERNGTRVQMTSNTLDAGALIAFGAAFAPASKEPPAPA